MPEYFHLFAAIRANEIAHIFYKAKHGHVHNLRHIHSLFHHHFDKILGGGDDDDARNGNTLEHGQGHVTRSGGHIDKEQIDVLPNNVRPKLHYRARNDHAAPNDGGRLVVKQ